MHTISFVNTAHSNGTASALTFRPVLSGNAGSNLNRPNNETLTQVRDGEVTDPEGREDERAVISRSTRSPQIVI